MLFVVSASWTDGTFSDIIFILLIKKRKQHKAKRNILSHIEEGDLKMIMKQPTLKSSLSSENIKVPTKLSVDPSKGSLDSYNNTTKIYPVKRAVVDHSPENRAIILRKLRRMKRTLFLQCVQDQAVIHNSSPIKVKTSFDTEDGSVELEV